MLQSPSAGSELSEVSYTIVLKAAQRTPHFARGFYPLLAHLTTQLNASLGIQIETSKPTMPALEAGVS